jgi:hypothetical protein
MASVIYYLPVNGHGNVRRELGVHVVSRVVVVVDDLLLFGNLVVFVVSSKYDDGRVVSQTGNSFLGFDFDAVVQLLI